MRPYKQVCICEKQPCMICFLLYDLLLIQIEEMLKE